MKEVSPLQSKKPGFKTIYDKAIETIHRLVDSPILATPQNLEGLGILVHEGVKLGFLPPAIGEKTEKELLTLDSLRRLREIGILVD